MLNKPKGKQKPLFFSFFGGGNLRQDTSTYQYVYGAHELSFVLHHAMTLFRSGGIEFLDSSFGFVDGDSCLNLLVLQLVA